MESHDISRIPRFRDLLEWHGLVKQALPFLKGFRRVMLCFNIAWRLEIILHFQY